MLDDVYIKEEENLDTMYSMKQEELGEVEVKNDNVLSTISTQEQRDLYNVTVKEEEITDTICSVEHEELGDIEVQEDDVFSTISTQ